MRDGGGGGIGFINVSWRILGEQMPGDWVQGGDGRRRRRRRT